MSSQPLPNSSSPDPLHGGSDRTRPGSRLPATAPNPVAVKLGYLGLLPFVFGAFLSLVVRDDAHPYVVLALAGYAAVVISFLGGIHWGLGVRSQLPSPAPFAWSVVPSLVAIHAHWLARRTALPAVASRGPVRREAPKVGRNDPCPCGSGQKYKKCCGQGPTLH